jgi:two-component system, cell cycle sensor histidine kinase and response regulator CckA
MSLSEKSRSRLKNASMKTRMALTVSLLFVGAAAVTAAAGIIFMAGEFRNSIADQQYTLAKSIADNLDNKLLLAQKALVVAAAQVTPAMLSDGEKSRQFLRDKGPLLTIFTNRLSLLDGNGNVVAESPLAPERRSLNLANTDYFRTTLATRKPAISTPFQVNSLDRQPVVALTAPLFNEGGACTGMLVGSLNLMDANFLGDLPRMKIGKAGYPYLFTSAGVMISHPDPNRIMKPLRSGANRLLDRARVGFQGRGETVNSYGVAMLTSFRRLQHTDWILGLNYPTAEAYAAVNKTTRYLVLGITATTLVVLLLVWFLMKRLTLPLLTVTRQVESMEAGGDLRQLDAADSSYEISTLKAAFNRLIETVQKQQKALLENEKKYRFIADNTYEWEFWLSPEFCFIYSSPSGKRITGYDPEAFLSDPELLERIIHPEDRAKFRDCLLQAMQSATVQETECRIVRGDGSVRWIAHLCKPVYDQDGGYLGLRGNNRDITDHKRMEDALLQSEERYRILVESSPDAILLHRHGVYLYANGAALRLFGADRPEQLVGQAVESTVHPEYRAAVKERIRQAGVVDGQVNPSYEEKVLRLDGSAIDVEAIGTQLSYQGEPAVQVVLRDITARIIARQALAESEETLRNLMEAMPVGVAVIDPQGRLSYVNRCFVERFGYSHDEIPTLDTWYYLVCPDPAHRGGLTAALDAATAQAQAVGTAVAPMELKVTCKDGSLRHVIINRHLAGNRSVAIFTDITERQSVQNELLKAQKLESLGVLAGGIAHDFNNILTGILGNITLAQIFIDETHNSFKPLGFAEKAALRAAELATQLLTFAKGGTPVKKPVCLATIVEESVSLALRGANVTCVRRIPSDLHAVDADEGQMSQAFHNIIINAAQAMPGGGILTVEAQNIALASGNLQALPEGKYVQISFADQGCGMAEEIQQKIFDPYYTTKSGGTGLGLASVHSIVRKHGGHVEVRSAVGTGTVFTFYLPSIGRTIAAQASEQPRLARGGAAGKGDVLVMDDEALIRNLATQLLQHLGYRVTSCGNGEDAVALYGAAFKSGAPYLTAIIDLTIPGGMGGREAAQHILEIDPGARLVVSSGYSNDPVMADFTNHGFWAAMAKPYRVSELAQILDRLTVER